MSDLLLEPFVTIGSGKNKLYKFANGQKTYTAKEFDELLRKNIEPKEEKNEVKPKARKSNKKDKAEETAEN